jgi:hypothetical protein
MLPLHCQNGIRQGGAWEGGGLKDHQDPTQVKHDYFHGAIHWKRKQVLTWKVGQEDGCKRNAERVGGMERHF